MTVYRLVGAKAVAEIEAQKLAIELDNARQHIKKLETTNKQLLKDKDNLRWRVKTLERTRPTPVHQRPAALPPELPADLSGPAGLLAAVEEARRIHRIKKAA